VVSWNLHDGRGDLPRLLDDLASGVLTGTPARDYVVLLQEAVVRPVGLSASAGGVGEAGRTSRRKRGPQPDLESLAAARGLAVFHVPVFAGRSGARGTAIVSTLPLRYTRAIDLPRERQHRVASAAIIDVLGQQLFVASAHFENRLNLFAGGPFADHARARQAEALVAALPPDMPGIVGGDLNTMLGATEPALRILHDRFTDTPAATLVPTFHKRLVLDHLFVDLPEGWQAARRVVADRYGSDHHPVVGTITAG
jgi:endonuclease/exonuclease/phosphatase family metal-dependent hydrolase